MKLGDIAHVRTGDKGDISQVSIIAYRPEDYPRLVRWVTPERVRDHFSKLTVRAIRRFELPSIHALTLILEGALRGGVTRSVAIDAHGKTLGTQLLDLDIPEI